MEFINANDLPAAGTMSTDNKVLVQQGDKFVLMTLAELLEYMASANVVTDPTLTLEGVAAEALATGKAVKAARAVNLLDNSDFKNPVNQRGLSEYSNANYTIDRWKWTYAANTRKCTVNGEGLHLENLSASTGYFAQYFGTLLKSVPHTVAVKQNGVVHSHITKTFGSADALTLAGGSVYILPDLTSVSVAVNSGETISGIEWIAIYEGEYTAETLPEYQPKGYAAELAECMRYYQKFGGVQVLACPHSDVAILITPPCKTKMRAYPTLSGVSLTHLRAGGKNITSFPSHTAAAFGTDPANPNYTLTFVSAHGASQFHAGTLYMSGELSADL